MSSSFSSGVHDVMLSLMLWLSAQALPVVAFRVLALAFPLRVTSCYKVASGALAVSPIFRMMWNKKTKQE